MRHLLVQVGVRHAVRVHRHAMPGELNDAADAQQLVHKQEREAVSVPLVLRVDVDVVKDRTWLGPEQLLQAAGGGCSLGGSVCYYRK